MRSKIIAALLLLVAMARAELVSRGENTGVSARALSMGGAFTAIADDYSALYYNASGMTQLAHSELGLNMNYDLRQNTAAPANGAKGKGSQDVTGVKNVALILTQGEGWALGLGFYSPTTYSYPLNYVSRGRSYSYSDGGNMDHYRLALAYAPSTTTSIGIAASYLSGREQLEIQDSGTVRYLDEYSGFNLEPSFLVQISPALTLGGSAVILEHLSLKDTYQEEGGYPYVTKYSIRDPFQLRLGLALQMGLTQASVDWHGTFWKGYTYAQEGDGFYQTEPGYSNQHVFAAGVEQHLGLKGPILRGGFSWEIENDSNQKSLSQPKSLSLGLGFPVSKNLVLDLGYQYRYASYAQSSTIGGPMDLTIDETGNEIMASARLRW